MRYRFRIIFIIAASIWLLVSGYAYTQGNTTEFAIIEMDLDHDGIAEVLTFKPRQTTYDPENPDQHSVIMCHLSKNNTEYARFQVDSGEGQILTFLTVTDWKLSDREHMIMVSVEHDNRAATANWYELLHFFVINSALDVEKLESLPGSGEYHFSASSGGNSVVAVRFISDHTSPYFLITRTEKFFEFDPERSKCGGGDTYITIIHSKFTYDAGKKIFLQEELDRHEEEQCNSLNDQP